jgi:hypothetical protein
MPGETKDMLAIATPAALGAERFRSERCQIGGLMLLLGTCVALQPLANIASLINTDDERSHIEKASLAGGFFQVAFGGMAMMVGYLSLVQSFGNPNLSVALILLTQTAWIPYITDMVAIGVDAFVDLQTDFVAIIIDPTSSSVILEEYVVNPFIPPIYLPTERDVRFFGAMGILGVIAYGVGFLGSLAFTEFTVYAFDMNEPMARNAEYYRGRLLFYTFVLVVAGMSQLLLGAYSLSEYGNGPLEPPLVVAMYTISFPEISITIGILQMLVGYFGIARYLGFVPVGPRSHEYQIMLLLQFIAMVALQYLTQIGYAPGDEGATGAGTIISWVLLSVGLNVLPAFLDYKMRTMPQTLTKEYFGITASSSGANKAKGGSKHAEEPDPLGGFAPLGGSICSGSSVYLNDENDEKDIEEAIREERELAGDSSEEGNSGWEDTTGSSESPPRIPKPLVSDDKKNFRSIPKEANGKDVLFNGDKAQSAPMPVLVQMHDDDDEIISPYDEEEDNERPPLSSKEDAIRLGDMDEDDEEVPDFVVEEEVIIGDNGEIADDDEQSQDPSEDNTPPRSNQSKEWDGTAGWIDHESVSGSDNSRNPIAERRLPNEDPPNIERGGNNLTRSDAPPDIKLLNPESPDKAGVKRAEPEQVITFSNSHHDEDESDENEEYVNEMNEIFTMIDPPEGRTPVNVSGVSYPFGEEDPPEVRTPLNVKEISYPFGEEDPPEVRTPINVKEVSYRKYSKPFPFGEDDIQDTASMVSMSGTDDSSEPGGHHSGDSMAILNQRLEDFEKELFTHSMDAYNKSLEDTF